MNRSQKINASPQNSGEHIREADTFAVLGGEEPAYQLVITVDDESDFNFLKNDKTDVELTDLKKKSPFGLVVEIKLRDEVERMLANSSTVSKNDIEAVIEKKLGDMLNLISGVSHEQTRDKIEIKIGHAAVRDGLTFEKTGTFIGERIAEEFPFVKSVDVYIYTNADAVKAGLKKAREIYARRDERALSLHDEDVNKFYGCIICQISSPAHVCVITPDRPSVCGTINWFEAGASCLADPDGPIFEIEKGESLDECGGEYAGINEAVLKNSGFENNRIQLYSLLENPHTTGSVFEIIAFYIPEANGIGLIDRATKTQSVNCLTFDEMMILTGYGQQISGFSGIGETYLLSDKFLQKEGGWENVVWMSRALKDKMIQKMQSDESGRYDKTLHRLRKIPTEKEVGNLKELDEFWKRHE